MMEGKMHETLGNVKRAEHFLMCCNLLLRFIPSSCYRQWRRRVRSRRCCRCPTSHWHSRPTLRMRRSRGAGGRTRTTLPPWLPHRQTGRGRSTGATLALPPFKAHSENHNPLSRPLLDRASLSRFPSLSEVLQQQMITLLKSLWPI